MDRRGQSAIVIAAVSLLFAACGDEDKRYNDDKIVEKLNLEKVEAEGENVYSIDGNLFCNVETKLLNTRTEVEETIEKSEINLVVTSREGNVGVIGVPIFDGECREKARKKLSKLDPEPSD